MPSFVEPILDVKDLVVEYNLKPDHFWQKSYALRAVNGISFFLEPGKTLGVVGESGSGKSSLARALLGLIKPTSGDIKFFGKSLQKYRPKDYPILWSSVQGIFQDPVASLNPKMTIGEILAEPLRTHAPGLHYNQIRGRIRDMLDHVGLSSHYINRYPHEFSGGQCQRVAIARAMMLSPKILVCDEVVSALDVSIQAQILNLLMDFQKNSNLSIIFISHNMAVVRQLSHHIMVLYGGQIVESADRLSLFSTPQHPYTQALMSAIPSLKSLHDAQERIILPGDPPSPLQSPRGCVFASRCPYVEQLCRRKPPMLVNTTSGHRTACHFWEKLGMGLHHHSDKSKEN